MNRLGHTLTGVAAGVWTLPIAPVNGPAWQAAWVAAAAGYALAPDVDHPGSTAARMWGPVSRVPARLVGSTFGHRQATHRRVGVVVVAVFVWATITGRVAPVASRVAAHYGATDPNHVGAVAGEVLLVVTVAVTCGLVLAACRAPALVNVTVSWVAAPAVVASGQPLGWLPWAASLGVAAHLAGDSITRQGLPGRRGKRVGLRFMTTGGHAETVVCFVLAATIAAFPFRAHLGALIQGVTV